jgi:hypothetical protein
VKQLGIQVVLILGVLIISWRLLAGSGQRVQALRRLGLLLLAAFAVWSILDPLGGPLTWLARVLGVGRAADLVLYGLVVAFFGFVVTTFRRFRNMETRYTRLARRIALDEAVTPTQHRAARHSIDGAAPAKALDPGRGGTETIDGADTVEPAIPPRPTSEHP